MPRKRLTLSDWAAVAQVVAGIAVVLSLAYVGLEVRNNTRAIQAAAIIDINNIALEELLTYATDSSVNAIMIKGRDDPSSLTTEERMRLQWLDVAFWLGMQTVFRQWQLGVLPDEEWDVYRGIICGNYSSMNERWRAQRGALIPAFVSLVERCELPAPAGP